MKISTKMKYGNAYMTYALFTTLSKIGSRRKGCTRRLNLFLKATAKQGEKARPNVDKPSMHIYSFTYTNRALH